MSTGYPLPSDREKAAFEAAKDKAVALIDDEGIDHGAAKVIDQAVAEDAYTYPVVVRDMLSSAVNLRRKDINRQQRD